MPKNTAGNKEPRMRPNTDQKDMLLSILQELPQLVDGTLNCTEKDKLWDLAAKDLNALATNLKQQKPGPSWQKCWGDFVRGVKNKIRKGKILNEYETRINDFLEKHSASTEEPESPPSNGISTDEPSTSAANAPYDGYTLHPLESTTSMMQGPNLSESSVAATEGEIKIDAVAELIPEILHLEKNSVIAFILKDGIVVKAVPTEIIFPAEQSEVVPHDNDESTNDNAHPPNAQLDASVISDDTGTKSSLKRDHHMAFGEGMKIRADLTVDSTQKYLYKKKKMQIKEKENEIIRKEIALLNAFCDAF